MRILFEMYHPGFLRNFEGPVRGLADRGHELVFAFERPARLGEEKLVAELSRTYPNLETRQLVKEAKTSWRHVASAVRSTGDYLRYMDRRYAGASALRERAAKKAPAWAERLGRLPFLRSRAGLAAALATFRAAEAALPVSEETAALMDVVKPDLVIVTPLVGLGSAQADVIKAARARGIPSVLGVASWDNLTNKGVIRAFPDRVLVWNDAQRDEAVSLHHISPERVLICGAWSYDHWFTWQAACSRVEFMCRVGLDPAQDYLLYVCSSPFIAPVETGFVRRWALALRDSRHHALRKIGLLIRPHPQNAEQWRSEDLSDVSNVVVWPRAGANPIDSDSRNDYFHSLLFSRGIVGINTSALIEAGIIGRPVFTITDREFAATQEGTLHFHHLTSINGGLLHTATTLGEHADQLAASLADPSAIAEKSRRFVDAFIRKAGEEATGTERFIAGLEDMEGSRPARSPAAGAMVMRPPLALWAWLAEAGPREAGRVSKRSERKRA